MSYEIWLGDDTGTRLALLDHVVSFDYAMAQQQVGVCSLTLSGDFDKTLLRTDAIIEIWRQPIDGTLGLERSYFLRRVRDYRDASGKRIIVVTAYDGNYLLAGRNVQYAASSSQSSKTDNIDDMMKAVVRENLGASATDTTRANNASYFSVQADLSLGASITRGFAYDNVLTVLQKLSEDSQISTPLIVFDVVNVAHNQFEFRTFSGQIGTDRSYPNGANPVLIGIEFGNLAEPDLEVDYTDEMTVVYAGGQGEGSEREIVKVQDAARTGRSIWGRREGWKDARNESATAGVTAAANALLGEKRPKTTFKGKLLDASQSRYGRDWKWGDKVTASYEGQSYNAIVKAVAVKVDGMGRESIDARIEVTI